MSRYFFAEVTGRGNYNNTFLDRCLRHAAEGITPV
jgi:hypothetical protein